MCRIANMDFSLLVCSVTDQTRRNRIDQLVEQATERENIRIFKGIFRAWNRRREIHSLVRL